MKKAADALINMVWHRVVAQICMVAAPMLVFKLFKTAANVLWLAVFAIVAAYIGRSYIDFGSVPTPFVDRPARHVPIVPAVTWSDVNQDIRNAVEEAREKALIKARVSLDDWHKTLMYRVDNDFMEWYFNYFNQQLIGLSYIYHLGQSYIMGSARPPSDKIIENIQTQFANRVLRPQIAQLELEAMTRASVETFVHTLTHRLNEIPAKYQMPQEEWDRHLDAIALMTSSVEGDRSVPITLKALTAGMGAASFGLMAKAFAPVIKTAASKFISLVSAKAVSTAAVATATATGTKVAGSVAGGFLGPIVAIGIVGWDLMDHAATVDENRPIMRQNINDYLIAFQEQMLEDEGSIGGVIHGLERSIVTGMARLENG